MPCLAASADVDHPKSPKPPPRIGFSTMLCQAKFMPTTQQCRGPTQISPRNIPQKSALGNPDKPGAGSRIGDGRRSAAFSATKPLAARPTTATCKAPCSDKAERGRLKFVETQVVIDAIDRAIAGEETGPAPS